MTPRKGDHYDEARDWVRAASEHGTDSGLAVAHALLALHDLLDTRLPAQEEVDL